ncbi:hypothetical protein [Salarchaeum japonicum]|uniref:Uncharacterized protein n=1 Tax=Salarchaeum japonicum TaxID=555573 RepID=A0AAV3SZU0_9EURY|nr:hypothetical protein [Salarchaeum japonicum]
MTKQLSNISDIATEKQNVPGQMTPVLEISPDDGLGLIIRGMVAQGSEAGIPIYADLRDSDGDPLPTDTAIALEYEAPSMDKADTVSFIQDNIRAYNSLAIDEQQNVENIDAVKHVLKGTQEAQAEGKVPTVQVRDIDSLYVSLKGDTQIDWAQSALYVDKNAVRQVS